MDETHVVTCFLRHQASVLLLRRSEDVGSYPGRWGAVAGHAEGDPAAAARREIREETGLDPEADVSFVRGGESFEVTDADLGVRWVVHPYLFEGARTDVDTNWETAAVEWVPPPAILRRETVPDLWRSYDRVRPRADTVAADTTHGAGYLSIRALEVLRDEAAAASEGLTGAPADWPGLAAVARDLRTARPAMPVVANRVDRAVARAADDRTPGTVETVANAGIDRALSADADAAGTAATHLAGARVATLSRSGTVERALAGADPAAILVAESRPGGEGIPVAEDLAEAGEDVTLTTDAAFPFELAEWGADALLVGADGLLPDGSVVNKVGTRAAALAAARDDCDVVVAAATDKVHPAGTTRADLDLEPREAVELYDGPAAVAVANPTFDVTPADAVDVVATERGPLAPEEVRAVAETHRKHARWLDAV